MAEEAAFISELLSGGASKAPIAIKGQTERKEGRGWDEELFVQEKKNILAERKLSEKAESSR